IMMPIIIVSIDELFFNIIQYILFFLLRNRTSIVFYFIHIILPHIISTAIATVIIYRFLVWINKYLKKKVAESEDN
ncbi:MAG: rod shape-determining protein MreD, partial [Eubacterium sp.]|nr:rod shape-determining protein MreD [Eubacterium sp.]